MDKIDQMIADFHTRDELRDLLRDVKDARESAANDMQTVRDATVDAHRSAVAYSQELARLFKLLDEKKLNLGDLGIALDTLFNV